MKKRKYIGRLLLLISMLVLVVPVFPHHHHHHAQSICVSNDVDKPQPHHSADSDCGSTCATKLHFSVRNNHDDCIQPQTFEVLSYFSETMFISLFPPHFENFDRLYSYIERLHGAGRLSAISLRAPPAF